MISYITACQGASGIRRRRWRLWLAYPIMTPVPLRSLRCVGWKPRWSFSLSQL